ncbi:MAG: 30S ribosomal protein S17e [Candidatus Aenigmatarchaeota archaeon]|nr:30S ribosomal protein S17e [Candidatus Aenigmarchaeota archaeon]
MGNIRTAQIKNVSERLVKAFPDKFTNSFEQNKKILDEMLKVQSKIIRNKVAGYITHMIEKENQRKPAVKKK